LTNSSKVNLISSDSKFVVLSFGFAFTRTGGKLSIGPPVGLPLLAHPLIMANDKIVNKILKFPVVPAIKTLLYLKTKNKIWLNVRPPLIKSSNEIIDELKKII
jgi:hypothetical protein